MFIATPSSLDMWNFGLLFMMKEKHQHDAHDTAMKIESSLSNSSQNSATIIGKMRNPQNEMLHITLAFTSPIRFHFCNISVCVKSHSSTRARPRQIIFILIFRLPAQEPPLFGKSFCDLHTAEQVLRLIDQNIIKIVTH